jgi:hypothetical protein
MHPHLRSSREELRRLLSSFLIELYHQSDSYFESGQKRDTEDYIKSVINTRTIKGRWKEGHRKLAIDVLTEKSNRM